MLAERFLLSGSEQDLRVFASCARGTSKRCWMWSTIWPGPGFAKMLMVLLQACAAEARWQHPMLWYTLSWLAHHWGRNSNRTSTRPKPRQHPRATAFPARLEEMIVLEDAIRRNPTER